MRNTSGKTQHLTTNLFSATYRRWFPSSSSHYRLIRRVFLLAAACSLTYGQNSKCVNQCTLANCNRGDQSPSQYATCVNICEKQCSVKNPPPPPPPLPPEGVIYPKYQILALAYAPPGCGSKYFTCATTNSVNYSNASSNGTTFSTTNSFKSGVTLTADAGLSIPGFTSFDAIANGGWAKTASDSNSQTISMATGNTLSVPDNIDGIDHGYDMFTLLLNPAVAVQPQPNGTVLWNTGFSGSSANSLYVYASELMNPSSMRTDVWKELHDTHGFTDSDFQTILAQDPFANGSTSIDPIRFVPVNTSISYEPALASQCTGGVCTCSVATHTITNSIQSVGTQQVQNEYTVGASVSAGLSVPVLASLKLTASTSFVWTDTSSKANTTSSSQSAQVTVGCATPDYQGPPLVPLYWDTLYGSFMFGPPSYGPVVNQGHVSRSGAPVAQQAVTLSYAGQVFQTFTDQNGDYLFLAPSGAPPESLPLTGQVSVGTVTQPVLLGSTPAEINLPSPHSIGLGGPTGPPTN